ncbi:hypothetical protein NIES2100_45360 [Calothrix sp. NIES-2100]|nr:hypothetical protein NIES2100_45360 [Calothrix sp. NIES-2100]
MFYILYTFKKIFIADGLAQQILHIGHLPASKIINFSLLNKVK